MMVIGSDGVTNGDAIVIELQMVMTIVMVLAMVVMMMVW